LHHYITYMSYASKNVDTLLNMLTEKEPKEITSGKLYWYGLWGGAYAEFIPNDATFQQMKNSGSLRYFTKRSLSEKVAQYDQLCRMTQTADEMKKNLYIEVRKSRSKIFEFKYNDQANKISQSNKNSFNYKRIEAFINSNPPLLTYDKTVFNQYVELVRSRYLGRDVTHAKILSKKASELLTELKKDYHLE
jgi:hypothetical protein